MIRALGARESKPRSLWSIQATSSRSRTGAVVATAIVLGLGIGAANVQAQSQSPGVTKILEGTWGPMKEEAPATAAATEAGRVTDYRRQQMRAISAHFRSIEAVLDHNAPFTEMVVQHAAALHELSRHVKDLFRVPSPRTGEWGAKHAIWQEPDLFAEHTTGFEQAAARLETVVRENRTSEWRAAIDGTRYQCLACHLHYARWEGRLGREGRRQ